MEGARGASSNAAKHKKGKSPMQIWRAKSTVQRWRPISTEAVPQKGEMSVEETGFNEDLHGSNISEKHSASVEVDASLMPSLKGKGGSTQKLIEQETRVKNILPSSKEETLVGKSAESNIKASEIIAKDLEEAAQSAKPKYTHFISLPLAIHPDLVEKLNQFQSSILGASASNVDSDKDGNTSEDFSIDKSIFINPKTFHLTVLMLNLWNEDRIAKASDVLRSISSQVNEALKKRLISIQLRGLTCMKALNDSPAMAQVVYAPVLEVGGEGRLTHACKVIIDAFVKSGLVPEKVAGQELKLHATVMNVRHRKSKKWNDSFDARSIFRIYGEQEWGEYPIPEVHLSQRFKYDVSGFYHCCCSIPLPKEM